MEESGGTHHQRLELERWTEMFSLSSIRGAKRRIAEEKRREGFYKHELKFEDHLRGMQPGGETITNPKNIAVVEQLRREVFAVRPEPPSLPVDVFVWALGESPVRSYTKVGGPPYWPVGRPWPRSADESPLSFVAQLCFADSRDVVGELPGDLLLIFSAGIHGEDWFTSEDESLYFEWVDLGLSPQDLIPEAQVPEPRWRVSPCWAVIHRTRDYPGARELFDSYKGSSQLAVLEGTKIGGKPPWIQGGDEPLQGSFLATVGSIWPETRIPFPFLNRKEPYPLGSKGGSRPPRNLLMWGDAGCLYLYLKEDGEIAWTIESY